MTTQVINPPGLSITTPSSQNDHFWKIIEKQRSIIQDLQFNLAKVTEERDVLLKQVNQSSSSSSSSSPVTASNYSSRQLLPMETSLTADLTGRAPSPMSTSRNSDTTTTMLSPTEQTNSSSSTTTLNNTTRRAATSPFDLMFSSSDSKPLSSNTEITLSPTQANDLKNYYIDEFLANDDETAPINSASPQPLRANSNSSVDHIARTPLPAPPTTQSTQRQTAYPQRQQSAPTSYLADSVSAHTYSTVNHFSPTQQHYPVDSTPQHSASLDMVRYEDSYYDPSLENEEFSPGLSPSKSPEMALPATPSSPVPMLANIMVTILSSNMTTNEKGKDIFSFTISVRKMDSSLPQGMEQLWCAEKLFSDFVNLDYLVKSKHQDLAPRLYRLPDKSLFLSKAPSKVDERKQAMEKYIQQVLTLPLNDMSDVCEFLSTNVIEQRTEPPKRKFGYLTKRGKNFGGWKMRFFVLDGPTVNYYENKGGPYMGSISLARAQIGRQVAQPTSGDSFRHALMILEPKKSAPQGVQRHVLCADSDLERDQWVDAMSQFINYDDFGQPPPPPTTTDYRQQLNKFLQRSTGSSTGTDSTQQQDPSIDDDKKNKSRNFWGKKMFNSSNTNNNNNNDLSSLTQALQGGLTPEQATALMNSAELSGYMDGSNVNGAKQAECGPNQVFGIPLDEAVKVCRISHDYELPALVYRCIEYLEAKDAAQEEGIYRLSGSAAKIKKLKEKFNQEGDVQLLDMEEYNHEVHAIAGLLKMWLRELPGSVVTMDLLNDFLHIADMEDRGERTTELGRLVSLLPLSNYTLLRTLSAHLIHIVQNAGINKMTLRNLGIVFSATLGIPAVIFNLFLTEFEYVFWTKQDHNQPILPPISPPPTDTDTLPSLQLQKSNEPTLPTTKNADISYDSSPVVTPNALSYTGSSPSSIPPPAAFPTASRNRSNRNSIQYTDYAPQSIVSLENRSEDFGAIIDEEDEDNTLGFDYDPYMEQQNLQSHSPQIIGGGSPTYEYTATVIEPQIRR
ncbi:hypothetical protein BCR42DRAFT_383630 [Absidia repens]|uniref:Rho GTPase activation protein n=1 Tax=Absidia repens TaxID=90262 RepID=A0A1X2I0Y6_9FUNG|nr:hypothetical protein BCR42DRAFT_383630 [Absidia repens]